MSVWSFWTVLGLLTLCPWAAGAQPDTARPACEPPALFGTAPCRSRVFAAASRSDSLDARAQIVVPDSGPVAFAVVIVGGGLVGHVAFQTDIWRNMCARLRCALLHFNVATSAGPSAPAEDPGRNAARGSGLALLALLDSLAAATGHPELARAKLALFGFSASGSFATSFATFAPARTLTAIRYHSHLRGLDLDTASVARVPLLLVASAADATAGAEDSEAFFAEGRRRGAPWALAVEAGRPHVSLDSWYEASDLIWHWIEALARSTDSSAPEAGAPWQGDPVTRTIGRIASVALPSSSSWLPDSSTAEAWRRLHRGREGPGPR